MIKFILFFILFYFGFKLLKGFFLKNKPDSPYMHHNFSGNKPGIQASEMVQDPVCQVYIPKSGALTTVRSGITHYFCSRECLEKFKAKNTN